MSGRSTPMSAQGSGLAAPPKPETSKPSADSFSNLVNFGGAKTSANLTLRERQEQLQAEKQRKEEERRKQMHSQYGGGQFWDSLGSGSAGVSRTASPAAAPSGLGQSSQNGKQHGDDDDLFAAFNKDTKVDNASHYPPPQQSTSGKSTPASAARLDLGNPSAWGKPAASKENMFPDDDDDPFGLRQLKSKPSTQPAAANSSALDDDDFLGDLGKPVDEVRRKTQASRPRPGPEPGKPIEDNDDSSDPEPEPPSSRNRGDDPFDQAVAELVDMGFSAENARRGLLESGAGLNVQAAVGWLLDDAHKTARKKSGQTPRDSPASHGRREENHQPRNQNRPSWARDDEMEFPSRQDNSSPASAGGDIQQRAAAMGSSFLKTANTLWKSGQKQVQKAYADFNQEAGDPNQPKWMRSGQQESRHPQVKQRLDATDEAMMLESGSRPGKPSSSRALREDRSSSQGDMSRDQSPALPSRPAPRSSGTPKWQQGPQSTMDPRTRLNKQAIEEQSAQAYVSPARRKKATPQPTEFRDPPQSAAISSADLLNNPQEPSRPSQPISKSSSPSVSRTITPKPAAPKRQIPTVSPSVLQSSSKHRLDGTAHFKRGDYDAAHSSYTNSLHGVPQMHPLGIVLLTNRALTSLKTGSPKQAVDDADNALKIIGPARGEGEKVEVGDGEFRDMKELYGKALSRKAEALEQMEKWSEAGTVWQLCVEAGVGGATATAGRQRCQTALAPKPKPAPKPVQAVKPRPKPSAAADLGPQKNSAAVERLKAANVAAEKADEEKFALSEKVDARISAWRDGKRDNLRALIGSLDQVLWEGSGWKKVGLHELVMANKVKIHYMKAIAKCHPDKVSCWRQVPLHVLTGRLY
jgi:hypothetical protein